MPPNVWNAARAKVQLRLSVQRLRTLQQKKEAQAKASRRDIATLIERGKIETARIKVESLIHEDVHIELLELLELYCELLLARFGVVDQVAREPDPSVREGICAIIFAAPRTELKELHVLRDILMHKYGRDFSAGVMENTNSSVSDRVIRKLDLSTPSPALVDGYMTEIARGYGVEWSPAIPEDLASTASSDPIVPAVTGSEEGSVQESPNPPPTVGQGHEQSFQNTGIAKTAGVNISIAPTPPNQEEDDFDVLAKRFAALKKK